MRFFINGAVLAALVMVACGPVTQTHAAPTSAPQADKDGDAKACVMQFGGHDVLRLTVPADTAIKTKDGFVDVRTLSPSHEVEIWLAGEAKTVDDAVGRVSEVIKGEFKDIKVTKSTDLTVAGTPAKRQVGTGAEADDGDAGQADVIVFKMGEHIFVACIHGEKLDASDHEWLLTLVQGAKGP